MNTTPSSPPPGPHRLPYGAVRLTGPVVAAPRPTGRAAPGRWYGPRVVIPLLSFEALRSGRSGG
ncbi:hypothetical protein QMK19_20070 [Streptomyces sp. H10-C2]|uniref:hypothetical protein n=1 Tax=unclassified Streptomyces TaxID=2593676 RepID=UPI0024BA1B05|nr:MULTISPECIES: hypothetical protein [unclassified Streptomyces]MDJ0344851.1 hypothetical protein [Streptomyces sp. PH10-H1]MDJ0371911.1 hypothetical protein [Streptomyces sp. H10-C2]